MRNLYCISCFASLMLVISFDYYQLLLSSDAWTCIAFVTVWEGSLTEAKQLGPDSSLCNLNLYTRMNVAQFILVATSLYCSLEID